MIFLLPVIASAAGNLVLGYLWYHPRAFGRVWIRYTNMTPEMVEEGKRKAHLYTLVAFLASAILAAALQYFGRALGVHGALDALGVGFAAWVGLVIPTMLGTVLWDQRPFGLFFINAGYWLASLGLLP